MASLNKVFLMGNLTKNPELKYSPSGLAVASFGIAINREWTDKSGEKKKETCFVEISMFGKRAEVISEHLSKGNPIFIEGHLQLNQWETKEGQKRSALRVIADNFQFIGSPNKDGNNKKPSTSPDASDQQENFDDISDENIPF